MTRSFYWSLWDVTSALWLWSLDVVFCQKEPELIEKSCFHFWVRKCTNVQDESRVFFITEIKFSWYTEFMSKWLQNKHEKISIGQSEYLGKKKISALDWNTSSMLNLLILSLPPSNLKKKNPWISMKVIGNKLNILKNVKKKIIHYLSCPSHRNYTPEKKKTNNWWVNVSFYGNFGVNKWKKEW